MTTRSITQNQKGFSLIEVLLGVAILGIIIFPLLNAMVVPAKTVAKTSNIHDATLAAQNIVETVNSLTMDDLINGIKNNTGCLQNLTTNAKLYSLNSGTYSEVTSPSGIETNKSPYYIGLKSVNYGNNTYDAMVKLDASGTDMPVSGNNALFTAADAEFNQPIDITNADHTVNNLNPDTQAVADFLSQASILSQSPITNKDIFTHSMTRTITINFSKNDNNVTAGVVYAYKYDAYPYPYTTTDEYGQRITETRTQDLTYSAYYQFGGLASAFNNVYFFYYPNYYTGSTASSYDYIQVNNTSGLKFNLYLVKQNTPGYTDGVYNGKDYDLDYSGDLELREPFHSSASINPYVTIFTNMAVHLGTNGSLTHSSVYRYFSGWRYPDTLFNNNTFLFNYNTSKNYFSSQIASSQAVKRLYHVAVDLYPENSNFTGTPVLQFDASKVN